MDNMNVKNKNRPEFDPDHPYGGIIPSDYPISMYNIYDVYDEYIYRQNIKLCRGQ